MDFFELVKKRRSVRAYKQLDVEQDKLEAILRCASAAPSAGNLQPFEIVVVQDGEMKQALAAAALGQQAVSRAPVVLVFLHHAARSVTRYSSRGRDLYTIQDTAIACTYAQLAAEALGLGSCWIGAFYPEPIGQLLKAPSGMVPAALLTVGYADETPSATPRRRLSDLVRWESF